MANRFLSNISINDAYTFPASDGTNGQVITTDGSGNLSFSDVAADSNFLYYTVKNSSGSTINKGAAVMAVGTDGNSGHILIAPMVADGSVEPKFFMGVLETTLTNGQTGRVIHFGELSQFNTNAFEDGDILWCDPAAPGGFTVTEPLGPNVKIAAAIVINASTNGKIKVRVQANEGLHELHDVRITSQTDGEVLIWDNTLGVWKNNNTLIVDHADGRVGIGESSPLAKAHVKSGSSGIAGSLSSNYDDFAVEGSGNTGITILSPNSNNGGIAFADSDSTTRGAIVYSHSSDSMAFRVATVEAMRIDVDGNLGVGTTTVTANLDLAADDIVNGVTLRLKNVHNGSDWGLDSKLGVIDFYSTDASAAGVKGAIELIQSSAGTTNPSATDLVFKTYGGGSVSEKMRINSSGYVGIGESSPDYPLHISSTFGFPVLIERTNAADAGIRFKDSTTTDADQVRLGARGNDLQILTGGSESMRIDSSGNVGIGTTTPSSKLQVDGDFNIANKYIYNQGYTSTTGAGVANGIIIEWKSGITTINTAYNYRIRLTTAGTGTNSGSTYLVEYNPDTETYNARMVSRSGSDINHPLLALDGATMVAYTNHPTAYPIQYHVEAIAVSDNDGTLHNMGADYHWQRDVNNLYYEDGNVGIGTSSPDVEVEIASAAPQLRLTDTDGGYCDVTNVGGNLFLQADKGGTESNSYVRFDVDGIERMRIDASGNVGIGTDSINGRLNIKSSGSGTYLLNLDYSNEIDGGGFYQSAGTGLSLFLKDSSASTKVQIATEGDTYFNGGSVGIGTTAPKARLDLNGTIAFDSKSMSISDTFATALTINMTQHRGCYVKITAFGDWASHSSVAYLGEFFIQHGADGYKEPGTIIRQVDNTYADSIEAKIVDPADGSVNKDFTIQLRATNSADTPFTIYLQYEVRGQFNSVS